MSKIDFKSLNKHMFDSDNKCIGFSIKVGEEFFNITKVKQNDKLPEDRKNVWQIRSCEELNLCNIMFELPKDDSSLVLITEFALHHLGDYLLKRIRLEQDIFTGIAGLLGDDNGEQ